MKENIEQIEFDLLLEAIFRKYGYDFRNYSKHSLKRLINHFMTNNKIERITNITENILYEKEYFYNFLYSLTITVTEMFRDFEFYKYLRNSIFPVLKTYPFIKIWSAGCSSGEEAYSLSILLNEERLNNRSQIYATDINDEVLKKANDGIYKLDKIKLYTDYYYKSGGTGCFSDYYYTNKSSGILIKELKTNILFSKHNLADDKSFGEMQLILCRNVMIYFDKILQDRILKLFDESLSNYGFLCLGINEMYYNEILKEKYKCIDKKLKIYQKRI